MVKTVSPSSCAALGRADTKLKRSPGTNEAKKQMGAFHRMEMTRWPMDRLPAVLREAVSRLTHGVNSRFCVGYIRDFAPCPGVWLMTNRERMQTVLRGGPPDRVPMVARLDIWHTARVSEGRVPEEVAGLSLWEIEDRLHMGRSARFRDFLSESRDGGVTESIRREGDKTIHTIQTGGRSVSQIEIRTPELEARGMLGQVQKYYLNTPDDYRTMIRIWERTRFVADHDACTRFGRDTGEGFIGLRELDLPEPLKSACREVPPSVFRQDISSSELRASGEA